MTRLRLKLTRFLLTSHYVSRWVVLGIDTVASAITTLIVTWVVDTLTPSWTLGLNEYLLVALCSAAVSAISFYGFGTYRGIMRHSSLQEMWRITLSVAVKSVIMVCVAIVYNSYIADEPSTARFFFFGLMDLVSCAFVLILIRIVLIGIYTYVVKTVKAKRNKRVFVFGSDDKSIYLQEKLNRELDSDYKVLGYITSSKKYSKMQLKGFPVYSVASLKELERLLAKTMATGLIFPDHESAMEHKDDVIDFCTSHNYSVLIVPKMNEIREGDSLTSQIRDIKIEDLLGRDVIEINLNDISSSLKDKTVMVTGGAGSIGGELCNLISDFGIKRLVIVDMAETPLHNMQLMLQDKGAKMEVVYVLADVKEHERMEAVFAAYRPDYVFHAAAYKHVPMVENNPCEGVNTNVFGTKNIADLALKYGVDRFVMVSTDKAVNPTNVMGCTKRIAEIYVQSLGMAVQAGKVEGKTKFVTTRFGNVLGSNGSVIPRFREQIMKGGPVTVTHKDIIRYFMTIPEACRLVLEAAYLGSGNKIYVFDMGRPVKIYDLARNMIELAGFRPDEDIKIEVTGLRPGEKLYEELLNNEENTIPTDNKKIYIAKVREYEYENVCAMLEKLHSYSLPMNKMETVRMMKRIVPEFKSNNSVYCQLDKELELENA